MPTTDAIYLEVFMRLHVCASVISGRMLYTHACLQGVMCLVCYYRYYMPQLSTDNVNVPIPLFED